MESISVQINVPKDIGPNDVRYGGVKVEITHSALPTGVSPALVDAAVAGTIITEAGTKGPRKEYPLFEAEAKNSVWTSLEVVPLHIRPDGKVCVYVVPRSLTDPIPEWRGKDAFPGHMIVKGDLAEDESFDLAWQELAGREFGGRVDGRLMHFVTKITSTEGRGVETAVINSVFIPGDLEGKYIPLEDLENSDMLRFHREVILPEVLYGVMAELLQGRLTLGEKENEIVRYLAKYLGVGLQEPKVE